jgi:hypothetical protein
MDTSSHIAMAKDIARLPNEPFLTVFKPLPRQLEKTILRVTEFESGLLWNTFYAEYPSM